MHHTPTPDGAQRRAAWSFRRAAAVVTLLASTVAVTVAGAPAAVAVAAPAVTATGAGSGAQFEALAPARVLDTRTGNGAPTAVVAPRTGVPLQILGQGGVPATGVRGGVERDRG